MGLAAHGSLAARSGRHACACSHGKPGGNRPRQSGHRCPVRLSRARYAAREGRSAARLGRRLVARAGSGCGAALPVPAARYAQPNACSCFSRRCLPPIGIMVGIYMFWAGADHPGGAFQGGAILAAMWLLVMIAGLRDLPAISRALAAAASGRRPGRLSRHRLCGIRLRGCASSPIRRLRQATDHHRRGRADALDRRDARLCWWRARQNGCSSNE